MITKREQIAKMIYLSKGMYSKNYKKFGGREEMVGRYFKSNVARNGQWPIMIRGRQATGLTFRSINVTNLEFFLYQTSI